MQDRLQRLAEVELPESQCEFQRGRGCTDMILMVHQLSDKACEHNTKHFLFSWISRRLTIQFHERLLDCFTEVRCAIGNG